jgi:hypothetical protein
MARFGKDATTGKDITFDQWSKNLKATGIDVTDPEQYNRLLKEGYDAEFGPQQDLSQFETLLGKLEGSKMRQQRQKSVEGRRDLYSQGLAQMMSNF